MTRYEYQERIQELKEEVKLCREVIESFKASTYIDGLTIKAYKEAMWKLINITPPSFEKIAIISECTDKIDYVNRQYDEHFPVKSDK
jgi:hypothetical protein